MGTLLEFLVPRESVLSRNVAKNGDNFFLGKLAITDGRCNGPPDVVDYAGVPLGDFSTGL